jgi:hypothetical protein
MAKRSNCNWPGAEILPAHTRMNHLRACLLLSVLVCIGCQDVHAVQKTGTEFSGDSKAVTYMARRGLFFEGREP